MHSFGNMLSMAAFALALMPQGVAGPLTVASIDALSLGCIFNPTCRVNANDSTVYVKLFGNNGMGRVQTRTFSGVPSYQAFGMTAYLYRVDMSGTMALGMANCVERFVVDAGPVAALAYAPPPTSQVFVVTTGEAGRIGLKSATQNAGRITFTFARPICPGGGTLGGTDSFYFGFASKYPPIAAKAQLIATMEGANADVRAPMH